MSMEKSQIRKEMETLGEAIYISWLKDCDKVEEMSKIILILQEILSKSSIEEYFKEEASDFNYFMSNFSNQVISNILKQPIIYGKNGENVALDLLNHYLLIFIKFMESTSPQYISLWNIIKEIFDTSKQFYQSCRMNKVNPDSLKLMTGEEYNNSYLKQNIPKIELELGKEIDICVNTPERIYNSKIWVRGNVTKLGDTYFMAKSIVSETPEIIKYDSFQYREKGTMTRDWDWRENLQIGDVIDCYERQKFYPATVMNRTEKSVNGMKYVEYFFAFRVYQSETEDLSIYKKIWNMHEIEPDKQGKTYLGDNETFDEVIPMYSKRLFPRNTKINVNFEGKLDLCGGDNVFFIDDQIEPIDLQGNKIYTIGRSNFSFFYTSIINSFGKGKGFDKIIEIIQKKNFQYNDILSHIYYILKQVFEFLYKGVIIEIARKIQESTLEFLDNLSNADLRNIRKETLELMQEVMNLYLAVSLGYEKRNEIMENFTLSFAIKMIKTTYLDKRISALKTIIDTIRSCRSSKEKESMLLDLIEKNQIFYEIYGPNSHVQLITKSKELLEIMLQNDKLSDDELKIIWGATKKGDLEGKLTIIKLLSQITLRIKHKTTNLLGIIISNSSNDLIDDEIDLIYTLCKQETNDELVLRCFQYLLQYLFESLSDDEVKNDQLILKLYCLVIKYPSFLSIISKKVMDSMTSNKNFPVSAQIISFFLLKSKTDKNTLMNDLMSELGNEKLTEMFISNFTEYVAYVSKKKQNWDGDIDSMPLNDHFTHSQNLKSKLSFLNMLLEFNLWKKDMDSIDFVYKLLAECPLCDNDEKQFYFWLMSTLSHGKLETELKIFNLFSEKICPKSSISMVKEGESEGEAIGKAKGKSIANLSLEAFNGFLQVFESINSNNKKIIKKEDEGMTITVLPQELDGFDILWSIIFESNSNQILNKGIDFLYNLFSKTTTNTNAITDNSSNSALTKLCLNEIKTTSNPQRQSKTILFLQKIIERSERYGTAGLICHNGLIRNNKITIEVSNNVTSGGSNNKEKLFEMIVYSNITIYDLKKKISLIVNYHFDFIRFIQIIKGKDLYEITLNDNGKTLQMMSFPSLTRINIFPNHLENKIPITEICIDKKPIPEVINVFHKWFDMFSSNNKMNPDDCGRFVKAVTNSQADVTASDTRVKELFNERDKNKDGFIEREEFIEFYNEAFPVRVSLVYDNLKAMGVRNDLLTMVDPYYAENNNKEALPRYQLANDEEFFNKIFNMQKGNDELAMVAYDFIGVLVTNPSMYKRIKNAKGEDWDAILSDGDIVALIYSLKIIEALIENLHWNEGKDADGDDNQIKACNWVIEFIQRKGFEKLIKLFLIRLSNILQEKSNYFTSLCFEYLIKIVKIFCIAAIDTFDKEKADNNNSNNDKREDDYLSILHSYLIKGNAISIIQSTLNTDQLITNLISLLDGFITQSKTETSKDDLINSIMELITILIPVTLSSTINIKQLIAFISYGIFHPNIITRKTFTESTIRMCTILQKNNSFTIIESIFNHCIGLLDTLVKENEHSSTQFFILFSYLIEILNTHQSEFKSTSFDIFAFIQKIVSIIERDLNEEQGTNSNSNSISDQVFVGYINIISKISQHDSDIKSYISDKTNLIQGILSKVLFKQNQNDIESQYANEDFIDIDQVYSGKTNNKGSEAIREICYQFILSMVKGSLTNFEKFFNINVMTKDEESSNENKKETRISNERKREGYVGLKNLGCICYMNSALQQFFMVPSFRYSLLRYSDNVKEQLDPTNSIDDNMLHQLQRMFSYLELSERVDYNPFGFTYSFKEFDGLPTKIIEQKDSQEFIGILLDRLENQSKSTHYKYVTQSIYGGKNCSQIICDQCNKASNRYEDTLFLSVEVKNMKTLNESLDKLISEEKIDGYKCEGCNQNVSITKRNAISTLPNVLIIHLQRILFNFEYDRNEKVNSRLEFPRQINLKPYTIEEMTRKNSDGEDIKESDDVYFRSDAYYDYYLMGVIVHSGTADSGHYYSYINTIRGGKCNEAAYNPSDQSMVSSWLEYNDSYISKYDVAKLEDDCFGGMIEEKEKNIMFAWNKGEKSRSAYLLVYERKIKFPIKVLIDPSTIIEQQNVISYKEEEENKIKKEYDIMRYYNTNEFNEKQEELLSKIFLDAKKGEYYRYIPYYYENRKMPKQYFLEIESDNSNFEKMQSISDDNFTQFFNKIIGLLDETMTQNKTSIKKETAIQISSTFLNFIFKILSKKDKEEVLPSSIEKFIHIVRSQPICQEVTWDYIKEHFNTVKGLIFNQNKNITKAFTMLITELIFILIESSKDELIEAIKDLESNSNKDSNNKGNANVIEMTKSMKALCIFEALISTFPKIPTKALGYAGIYINMIKSVLNKMPELFKYFAQKEFIYIFITFLIGKDSPCYKDTQDNIRDTWDHTMRSFYLVGAENIVDLLYDILMKSSLANNDDVDKSMTINLSSRDISCLYSTNFLKYIFKKSQLYFSKFLIVLNVDNKQFTESSCIELIKNINDIDIGNDSKEFTEIIKNIIPLLSIKDKYQQNRFEILLGIPQYDIESSLPYPLFGYHLMASSSTKCFENNSTYKHLFTDNIIQKLYEVQNQYTCGVESFLLLLEACLTNDALWKYLKAYQYSNITLNGFIEWGVCTVNNYGQTEDNQYRVQLKNIVQQLNTEEKLSLVKDKAVLPGFVGFNNDYLIKDVKMAEIQLMFSSNDVYFFLCDYTADYIPLNSSTRGSIDYSNSRKVLLAKNSKREEEQKRMSERDNTISSNSKSNVITSTINANSNVIDNNNPNPFNSNEQFIIQADSITKQYEREFFQSIIRKFDTVKKVVIESNSTCGNDIPNAKSVLRRIVGLNLSRQTIKFELQLLRDECENPNEYIPTSQFNCSFNNNPLFDIYRMSKWDPDRDWTWNLTDTKKPFEFKVKVQYNQYPSFNTYNGLSAYGTFQYTNMMHQVNDEESKDNQAGPRSNPNIHDF